MENHEASEVCEYLTNLKRYLGGDFETFRKICNEFEARPNEYKSAGTSSANSGSQTDKILVPKEAFNLTIPFTLTLFATADILGYLYRQDGDHKQSTQNLKAFFERTEIDSNNAEFLITAYRHGMVHSYFPKLGLEISFRYEY